MRLYSDISTNPYHIHSGLRRYAAAAPMTLAGRMPAALSMSVLSLGGCSPFGVRSACGTILVVVVIGCSFERSLGWDGGAASAAVGLIVGCIDLAI